MMMMISYDGCGLEATSLTVPDLFMLEEEGGGRRWCGGVNTREESNISIVYYVNDGRYCGHLGVLTSPHHPYLSDHKTR